jgi:serine-type D-Ala-D-Ala carboxypeptidase (penicillin-binding protein 5/6)
MSDNEPIILPEDQQNPIPSGERRFSRFPAVAQLLVLFLVLGALFGGLLMPSLLQKPATTPLVVADTTTNPTTTTVAIVPEITPPSNLKATAVYVYDVATKRALYHKNADEVLPLASITKLMTALVARELVTDDMTITVPRGAVMQAGGSGLALGEQFSSKALRDYALLASSNDAAYTLAAGVGQDLSDTASGERAFIEAMNITAEELSLSTLTFKNATGLDISASEAGAYGSARDVSFLMEYILRTYPDILEATRVEHNRIYNAAGAYHEAENTNPVISRIPNLIGSKTGYTDLAQGNLTIAFDAGYNRPIIVTVLGSTYDERFSDTMALVTSIKDAFAATTE